MSPHVPKSPPRARARAFVDKQIVSGTLPREIRLTVSADASIAVTVRGLRIDQAHEIVRTAKPFFSSSKDQR